jgi:hypothetical protein
VHLPPINHEIQVLGLFSNSKGESYLQTACTGTCSDLGPLLYFSSSRKKNVSVLHVLPLPHSFPHLSSLSLLFIRLIEAPDTSGTPVRTLLSRQRQVSPLLLFSCQGRLTAPPSSLYRNDTASPTRTYRVPTSNYRPLFARQQILRPPTRPLPVISPHNLLSSYPPSPNRIPLCNVNGSALSIRGLHGV